LLFVTGVLGYISRVLMVYLQPNPVFGPMQPQVLTAMFFGGLFLTTGLVILIVAFARAVESDLKVLASSDSVIEESIKKLTPKVTVRIACLTLGLLYGLLILPVLSSYGPRLQLTVIEAFIAITSGGPESILGFILAPIGGLASGIGLAIVISQITSLLHAARHIRIDFLILNEYASIANPGVRLLLCWLPLLSTMPLLMLYTDDAVSNVAGMRFQVFLILIVVAMLIPYLIPIWILRNRIRDKKLIELDQIKRALQGDKEANKLISIQGQGAPMTTTDLLTHQMFLESRWEWPIASHIQKIIFFGLLPPTTWVLAAIIENTLY